MIFCFVLFTARAVAAIKQYSRACFPHHLGQVFLFPWWLSGKQSAGAGDLGSVPGPEDPVEAETATHFSILAWEIAWAEGWRTTVLEVARVRHDLVTRQHFPSLEYPKLELFITKFLISPGPILPKGTVTMHNNKNLAQSLVDRWEVGEGREGRELKPSAVVISRMGTVM